MADPKTAFNGVFADAASFNKKVKVFWFGAGEGEAQFTSYLRIDFIIVTIAEAHDPNGASPTPSSVPDQAFLHRWQPYWFSHGLSSAYPG